MKKNFAKVFKNISEIKAQKGTIENQNEMNKNLIIEEPKSNPLNRNVN